MTAPALPAPRTDLKPNTADFERLPFVKPTGFREYDARWLFGKEINLMGMQAIGMGLATLCASAACRPGSSRGTITAPIRSSHQVRADRRACCGRRCEVHDIGLALSPMAYFAQFALEVDGRGDGDREPQRQWLDRHQDGHGASAHLRPGRDDRAEAHRARRPLRKTHPGGSYHFHARYARALYRRPRQPRAASSARSRPWSACGNGTAGAFAPQALARLGLRGGAAGHRSRLQLSRTTIRTPKTWRCCTPWLRCGEGERRGCGPWLRRRRRPLRRGRRRGQRDFRRQDRRDAGARSLGRARERAFRGRREIDRPVRHRSGAAGERRTHGLLENRPLLYQAPHPRDSARWPASRSPATSSSIRRSAAATTTGSWRRSRSATCSIAQPGQEHGRSVPTRCPRPGTRRPCRPIAPTRRNMAWSSA